ncbi:MAG TPA: hypothetical protein VFN13_05555 [Rudaea sp.]|nr:hypothetical protein [Rudaea sp.]
MLLIACLIKRKKSGLCYQAKNHAIRFGVGLIPKRHVIECFIVAMRRGRRLKGLEHFARKPLPLDEKCSNRRQVGTLPLELRDCLAMSHGFMVAN